MAHYTPRQKFFLTLLAASLAVPTAPFAQEQGGEIPAETAPVATGTVETLPDYFYIPIWGLRVGGTDLKRPPPNDSWKYFKAGRAMLKVTPALIDYGTHEIGTPLPQDVIKLQNVGADTLTLGDIVAPHQYIASKDCDAVVLPPMGTCLFTLQFSPVDLKSATGQVSIPFSAKGGAADASISVSATTVMPAAGGPGHSLGLESAGGDYTLVFPPPIYLGDAPKFRQFVLNSTGTKALSIKDIAVVKGSMFYAPSHDCPEVLEIGASCTVVVQLNPLAIGEVTGELRVTSASYDDSDVRVRLLAEIDEWVRKVQNPEKLDFGVVDVGYASTRTVTFKATGNLPVEGLKVTAPAPFTVSATTCNKTLQPNDTCAVTFSLNRSVVGPVSGTAVVTATDLSIAATNIELSANVQLRQGTFSPTTYAFGLKDMAKMSEPRKLTFTNTGTIAVTPAFGIQSQAGQVKRWISDWAYLDAGSCAFPVDPGNMCEAYVSVQPTLAAAQSASVTVYPDKDMSVRGTSLTVSATGTKQSFVYNPTVMDLGVIDGIRTVEASITVVNTSLDATTLTGFGTAVTQPKAGRGTITLSGGTCASTLTAAAGTCVIKAQISGTSLAADEIQESNDGVINFRYSGADTAYTVVPVKFLLRGSAPTITSDGLDFGGIPVGVLEPDAPRRLITVTNPGPSAISVSGIAHTPQPPYGLKAAVDHSWPESCGFNKVIEPGTSCVVALYPTSAAQATWGEVSTPAQLQTVVNGVTVNLGPAFTMKANHLPVTLDNAPAVTLEAGEMRAMDFVIPLKLTHGGSAYFSSQTSATGTGISASLSSACANRILGKDAVCELSVRTTAMGSTQDRQITVPLRVGYENTTREIGTIVITAKVEGAQYSVTPAQWDLGDVTAQGLLAETPALRKYSVVKNESARANLVVAGVVQNTGLYSTWGIWPQMPLTVDGQTVNACNSTTLVPQARCYVGLDLATGAGNVQASGEFSHSAQISTGNEMGNIELPIRANFLTGELEILEQPDHFRDIPSATTSATKVLKLRNKGQGNVRFVVGAGMSGQYTTVSDSATVDFKLLTPAGTYSASVNSATSTHKAAGTDETQNCASFFGLQAGAVCSLYVAMTPTGASRDYSGKVVLEAAYPAIERIEVPLQGNSLASEVYYSATSFNFPTDMRVSTEYVRQIVVGNAGNYPLSITGLLLRNAWGTTPVYSESELKFEHNCPVSLPAGEECTLQLTLTPDRNLDWTSASPKHYVQIVDSHRGVASTKTLYLTGASGQSLLTASELVHQQNGPVERSNFPSQYMYNMEFSASGEAPVRILTAKTGEGPVLYKNSTCTAGRVLEPGDTCTIEVWSAEDLATSLNSAGMLTFYLSPFTINGTHVNDEGAKVIDRNTRVSVTLEAVAAAQSFQVVPPVVSAHVSVPSHLKHPSFRAGLTLNNDGKVTRYDDVSYPEAYVSDAGSTQSAVATNYLATGQARDVTVKLKNGGIAPWHEKVQKAEDFNMYFEADGAQVFTSVVGESVTTPKGWVAGRVPAGQGGALVFTQAPGYPAAFSVVDYSGKVTSTMKAPAGFGISQQAAIHDVRGVEVTQGSYLVMVKGSMTSGGCGGYGGSCTYYYTSPFALYQVAVTGDSVTGVTLVDSGDGGSTTSVYYVSYDGHAFVADSDNYVTMGVRREGVLWVQGRSDGVNFSATQALSSFPAGISGVAALGGYYYLWSGDALYMYETANMAKSPIVFRFPGVFNERSRTGISYSATSSSFIMSCYAGTAMCTIPVYRGAVGVAAPELGNPGQRGYNDGGASATLDIETIAGVSAGDPIATFVSASGAKSTRSGHLSALPTIGSLGVSGAEFEATYTAEGAMVPHSVSLKNLSLTPLNILGVSDSKVSYSTTCVDIPYGGDCEVTIEIQPDRLSQGIGRFTIETTVEVDPVVSWTGGLGDPDVANLVYSMPEPLTLSRGQGSSFPASSLAVGTKDFTAEFYFHRTEGSGLISLLEGRPYAQNGSYLTLGLDAYGRFSLHRDGRDVGASAALVPSSNTSLHHVAYSRTGGKGRLFVDGQLALEVVDNVNYAQGQAMINYNSFGVTSTGMYIAGLRIYHDVARYTANFTPKPYAYP